MLCHLTKGLCDLGNQTNRTAEGGLAALRGGSGLSAGDLAARMRCAGSNFRILRNESATEDALMNGRVGVWHFHSGLTVHATDAVENDDLEVRIELDPSVAVAILLEGEIEAELAGSPLSFGETAGGRGAVWSHAETATLRRQSRRHRRVRKVIVSVPPDWFGDMVDAGSATPSLGMAELSGHGAFGVRPWRPSLSAIASAEEILACAGQELDVADRLQLEIRGIQILRDAVAQFIPARAETAVSGMAARDIARAHAARDFIRAHPEDPLNLAVIARETGMSVSTLQRAFRECFGESVMNHVRRVRLESARDALRSGSMSVSAASRMAGYSSAANFATAFQRTFGYPPSSAAQMG